MSALLLANLRRRLGRALLTAAGTAVGVATIVAMLAVTSGVQQSAGQLVHLGSADLAVFQAGVADPTASILPDSLGPRLERLPAVAGATPLLLLVEAVPRQPAAIVFGADPAGFVARRLVVLQGRAPRGPGEVAVGDVLAREARVGAGATLTVARRPLRVVGVYHAGISFEDGGAFLPLGAAQALAGRRGDVTTFAVQLAPGASAQQAEAELRRSVPGVLVIGSTEEAARAGANGQLISKAVLVIVVLALIVGGIAVANTMLLAVLERRTEYALLAAVGWSPRQIAGEVLAEGVVLSVVGAAVGLLLGVAGSELLVRALGVGAFVSPNVTAWGLGRGLIVGLAIGVLGGLYPAWRITRLPPATALARR